MAQPEVGEDCALIHMGSDLLDPPLCGDVLGVSQLHASGVACKRHEIAGNDRYRAPRALLPRGISCRVHDDLTDDSPTGVVRITPRDEKPSKRFCHALGSRIGRVAVQMAQRIAYVPTVLHRPGQLPRAPPRSVLFIVDLSTLLGAGRGVRS